MTKIKIKPSQLLKLQREYSHWQCAENAERSYSHSVCEAARKDYYAAIPEGMSVTTASRLAWWAVQNYRDIMPRVAQDKEMEVVL